MFRGQLILSCFLLIAGTESFHAAPKLLIGWEFMTARDLQGWTPNSQLTDVTVADGALNFRAVGSDPILEYRPLLDVLATAFQAVEIRLWASSDGVAELFWSNASTGPYGGFAQEKSTRFNVRGDSRWHTYRLLPGWHAEGKIARLRFDVYDGSRFKLASIRLVELEEGPAARSFDFDFGKAGAGWQWVESDTESEPAPVKAAGTIERCGTGFMLGPPLRIESAENTFVSIRMSVDSGRYATLLFATDRASGLHKHTFPIEADGREHTYNVDLLQAPGWSGTILALGLQPSEAMNSVARIFRITVAAEPQGPAHLRVISFGLDQGLARAGLAASLAAIISNDGGLAASNIEATLELPEGIKVLEPTATVLVVPQLGFDEEKTLTWQVEALKPVSGQARLTLKADGTQTARATAELNFTSRVSVAPTGYVPKPEPVRGPYEVGVYYFPGWKTASQWEPLRRFPERKPVLGWYREGEPEVADWHIKWAVEHGITFFAYDWYWSKGARQLEHALHEGYFKARYRELLKFCLLWANHNPQGSSSQEDSIAVARHWIEHYFRRPEYLRFDGKPVMILFAPDRFTQDLGSAGTKKALDAMRAECKAAGLGGLYLVACIADGGGARRAADEGYDSVTAYNWPALGMSGEGMRGPFDTLVDGYRRHWETLLDQNILPLAPLPVCGGWDSRPWHGENNLVRYGRTPALFRRHLQDARQMLESRRFKPSAQKTILIEAWNEWGEGSYIEPHAEFGFGYLDAVRDTFADAPAAHADVTPADAGLGPYDVEPSNPSQTVWDFAGSDTAWGNTMEMDQLKFTDGVLSARTTGNDGAFFGPGIRTPASGFTSVLVRMRLSSANQSNQKDLGQLFWRTTRLPESESTSEKFTVQVDGNWHEYRIPVATNRRWRGTVTRLRLDPVTRADTRVEIRRIELCPGASSNTN